MAAVIYRKALEEDLTRGRTISAITAASLYVACRFTRTPKTLDDIVKVSSRSRSEISRAYRLIIRELKIKMPSHDPLKYISRIGDKAGIPGKVQILASRILNKAKRKRVVTGKDPLGIVAAALYIASQVNGEEITQKAIAEAAGTTGVTLRKRKKEIVKKIDLSSIKK